MKKTAFILLMLTSIILLLMSCQKGKEAENKAVQRQTQQGAEMIKDQQPAPDFKQGNENNETKTLSSEEKTEAIYKQLQREFREGVAFAGGEAEYRNDMCECMKILWEEGNQDKYFSLIIQILKKDKDSAVRACAAKYLRYKKEKALEENKKTIVSSLKNALQDKASQLPAAGSLMSWEEYDTALPVLDKNAREGHTWALAYLFKGKELFDPRGKDILMRALDYPSDEVKMVAAAEMAKRGWERVKSEEKAIAVLRRISELKDLDPSEHRALDFAQFVLKENKSKNRKAIELLEKIAMRSDMRSNVSYHEQEIKATLKYLKEETKQ